MRPSARRRIAHAQLLRQRERNAPLLQVRGAAAPRQGRLKRGELRRQVRACWGGFAQRWWACRWRLSGRRWLVRPLCLLRAGRRPLEGRLALLLLPPALAGLTDLVWTLREVLLFRAPPSPQPVGL
jgi:hypothetical protein